MDRLSLHRPRDHTAAARTDVRPHGSDAEGVAGTPATAGAGAPRRAAEDRGRGADLAPASRPPRPSLAPARSARARRWWCRAGRAGWSARARADEIREIGRGETISVGEVELTGVPALHDGCRDRWARQLNRATRVPDQRRRPKDLFRRRHRLVRWDGGPRPVDLALLPVWGWGPSVGEGTWTRSGRRAP